MAKKYNKIKLISIGLNGPCQPGFGERAGRAGYMFIECDGVDSPQKVTLNVGVKVNAG